MDKEQVSMMMKKKNIYTDEITRSNFDKLVEKIQLLFSRCKRSRHVVFTSANLRMLYILYVSKIQERTQYCNHKCHLCIIYDRQDILAMDINTRPQSCDMLNKYMKHAEINAINKIIRVKPPRKSCGIFVTRFNRHAELNNSDPCYFCTRTIKKHMNYFHTISYTNTTGGLVILTASEYQNKESVHRTRYYKCNR